MNRITATVSPAIFKALLVHQDFDNKIGVKQSVCCIRSVCNLMGSDLYLDTMFLHKLTVLKKQIWIRSSVALGWQFYFKNDISSFVHVQEHNQLPTSWDKCLVAQRQKSGSLWHRLTQKATCCQSISNYPAVMCKPLKSEWFQSLWVRSQSSDRLPPTRRPLELPCDLKRSLQLLAVSYQIQKYTLDNHFSFFVIFLFEF